jgi:hypothetical protein
MAVTPLDYDDIVDIRFDPFANAGQGEFNPKLIGYGGTPVETRLIPASAPYVIKLYEAPQQNVPSTTIVELVSTSEILTEVSQTKTPASKQYRVIYYDNLAMGLIEFHSSQAGLEVDISYYGLGHLIQKISLDTRVPNSGNTNIGGIKTFTDTTASSSKDTGAIVCEGGGGFEKALYSGANIYCATNLTADGGTKRGSTGIILKEKTLNINDWDMNLNTNKSVAHGLGSTYKKIRSICVIIRNDADTIYYKLARIENTADPFLVSGGVTEITSTNIVLVRRVTGFFDSANFDSTSYNRGWVYVLYEA